jgi:hypothetical protein
MAVSFQTALWEDADGSHYTDRKTEAQSPDSFKATHKVGPNFYLLDKSCQLTLGPKLV